MSLRPTTTDSGSTQIKKKNSRKNKWLRLLFLHRYMGLLAAFFAIFLSVSGILLNHTEELGLHKQQIKTAWLMQVYGIKTATVKQSYQVEMQGETGWVVELGDVIFLNDTQLACDAPLKGALVKDDILLVSNKQQLCLLTFAGELIDTLRPPEQTEITQIGSLAGDIYIGSANSTFKINTDFTELQDVDVSPLDIQWRTPEPAPKTVRNHLLNQYQGEGLPLERIILDLHSGRLLGKLGIYFMDAIGVLMIFLAVTGFLMWAKKAANKRRKLAL